MNSNKIDQALVDLLADQVKQTTLGGCLLITLVGTIISFSFPANQVFLWMFVGYLLAIPRFLILAHIQNSLTPEDSRIGLEWIIGIVLFASGLHWGAAGWLFLDTSNVQDFALVCGAILGVIASSLAIYSTKPLICCLFTFTVFSIVSIKLATLGNWGLVIMCLVVLPPYALGSRTLGRRIEQSVTQDFRNAELLQQVREANDAMEKASREKSLFMTATSHDLRQPLHAQSMYLQIMSTRAKGTEFEEIVDKVMISNDALIALFNSLLEVSQLDAGTIDVHASHHSLLEVASLIVEEFQEIANQKGLKIELVGSDYVVYSDPILLLRILRNLVSNAVKFTNEGKITLKLQAIDSHVQVSVIDTGIGIPQSEQNTIFSEYTQLQNPSRDRNKGIGLGLALVRRMCQLLQHELWVSSEPGVGSSFHIAVPSGKTSEMKSVSHEPVSTAIQNLDVMVIDDEQPILDAMYTLFSDWNCRARTFSSLLEARSEILDSEYLPDLIITDYRLDEHTNGIEVIGQLRQLLEHDVPAIIISGDTDPLLLESIQNEDFYLLHKPVNVSKLRKVIGSLLRDENEDRLVD